MCLLSKKRPFYSTRSIIYQQNAFLRSYASLAQTASFICKKGALNLLLPFVIIESLFRKVGNSLGIVANTAAEMEKNVKMSTFDNSKTLNHSFSPS